MIDCVLKSFSHDFAQIIGKNGGEDTLAHWPIASGMMTIDEASCEVLKYLDKIWNSLSSSGRLHFCCVSISVLCHLIHNLHI